MPGNHYDDSESRMKKGIEATRRRLNSSLNTAIDELSGLDQRGPGLQSSAELSSSERPGSISTTTAMMESLNRHSAMERINSAGFTSAAFKSSRQGKGRTMDNFDAKVKDHDKAMFGPMWASKELQQKRRLKTEPEEEIMESAVATSRVDHGGSQFPIAHESFSEDPATRQARWLELFRRQRRELLNIGARSNDSLN